MKLCKDCAHCNRGTSGSHLWLCESHPHPTYVNPVDGESKKSVRFCDLTRQDNDKCGPDGAWFEQATDVHYLARELASYS